jgi:uncharacterized membrane protein YdbT with pleckstrin-like domain
VLRFEEGFLRKSQRTLMLTKIEDVRVEQSLLQRLFGLGDLAVQATGTPRRCVWTTSTTPAPSPTEFSTRPKPPGKLNYV